MVPRSSVYKLFNKFKLSNSTVLPGSDLKKINRGTIQKFFVVHGQLLIEYYGKYPSSRLGLAIEELVSHFEGFTISFPALWKYLAEFYLFFFFFFLGI